MTMKILLPVDGSACALRAVDHLIAHAAWFKEVPEIHLLHVLHLHDFDRHYYHKRGFLLERVHV